MSKAITSHQDGPQLARELRKALDDLMGVGEDAGELVCIVEDSFGLDYPAVEDQRPTAAEQAAAKMAVPGTLEALAKAENQMRRGDDSFGRVLLTRVGAHGIAIVLRDFGQASHRRGFFDSRWRRGVNRRLLGKRHSDFSCGDAQAIDTERTG